MSIAMKLISFFLIILGLAIISELWYHCGYHDAIDDALKAIDEVFAEKRKELEKEHTEKQ